MLLLGKELAALASPNQVLSIGHGGSVTPQVFN
jgi:hypothetical protein